jgi:DNA repair protein RadA/Sms
MAKKPASLFVCSSCGAQSSAWAGRCAQCGEWNTLEAQIPLLQPSDGQAAAQGTILTSQPLDGQTVAELRGKDNPRYKTLVPEIDEIFGGGVVRGSVNLLAGQPGIGKSTILLQIAYFFAKSQPVLYVNAEESAHQVSLRAGRLGALHKNLHLASSTSTDDIAATIAKGEYKLVIVDSIQTISCRDVASAAGSVSQTTNSTHILTSAAKQSDTALIIVGHVTKEGSIAGPKILEHLVDVVLQLEGERYGGFKMLRAVKNRYGSTNETGIFEMKDNGLQPVENPSAALLAERQVSDGSVVFATIEGTRPLLVEVQALVNKSAYGYPKRAGSGVDLNRLNLLIAVLEKRTKLQLAEYDIYVNIVGGIKISEPAADLAICMAIGSAARSMQLAQDLVVFGEVGLSGEIRRVSFAEKRLAEAKKLGFAGAIAPNQQSSSKKSPSANSVKDLRSALNNYLEKP